MDNQETFVGRERLLEMLRQNLKKGVSCQIVAPSGFGKTMLLKRIAALAPDWSPALRVAYVDARPLEDEPAFWSALGAAWKLEAPSPTPADIEQQVRVWVKEGIVPVIALDNFDALATPKQRYEFIADFFLSLRALATSGACFVVTSQETLSRVMNPYYPTSPFFNVFPVEYLGKLSAEDAEDYFTLEKLPLSESDRSFLHSTREVSPALLEKLVAERRVGKSFESALK